MIHFTSTQYLLKFLFAVFGLLGTVLFYLLFSMHAIGISPDSVTYISVARHLLDGSGFICYDGYPYVLQAPLYPVLLSVVSIVAGLDPILSAGYVNAALFGLIVYFSGVLFAKHLKSLPLALLGAAATLFSFILVQASLIALSEPLFILLTISAFLFFEDYRLKKSIRPLLGFSAAVALACLTRYAGVILIVTGSFCIFAFLKNTVGRKFKHVFLFLSVSFLPAAFWIARNYYLSGTLVGQRSASSFSFIENFFFMLRTIFKWYSPLEKSEMDILIVLSLLTAGVIFAIFLLVKFNTANGRFLSIGSIILFVIFYTGMILISSTTTAFDKIDNRLLSPLFIPVVLLVFIIIDKTVQWLKEYLNEGILSVVIILELTMWIKYQASTTKATLRTFIAQNGCEYSGREWKDNSVISFLKYNREVTRSYALYSNVPEAVYLLANINTKWSPPKTNYNSPTLLNIQPSLAGMWSEKSGTCLVWFNNVDRKFLFTLEELAENSNLQLIAHLKDGSIYTISEK